MVPEIHLKAPKWHQTLTFALWSSFEAHAPTGESSFTNLERVFLLLLFSSFFVLTMAWYRVTVLVSFSFVFPFCFYCWFLLGFLNNERNLIINKFNTGCFKNAWIVASIVTRNLWLYTNLGYYYYKVLYFRCCNYLLKLYLWKKNKSSYVEEQTQLKVTHKSLLIFSNNQASLFTFINNL